MKNFVLFVSMLYLGLSISGGVMAQMKDSPSTLILSSPGSSLAIAARPEPLPSPTGEVRGSADVRRNSIYFELGGNALFYSINYDNLISNHFAIRAGLGYFGIGIPNSGNGSSDGFSIFSIPITGSFLFFPDISPLPNSKFEVGGGVNIISLSGSFGSQTASGLLISGTGILGYRYQPPEGGILFRAGFTPVFGAFGFYPDFGLSVGYTF